MSYSFVEFSGFYFTKNVVKRGVGGHVCKLAVHVCIKHITIYYVKATYGVCVMMCVGVCVCRV
jgi:hypothetical protein